MFSMFIEENLSLSTRISDNFCTRNSYRDNVYTIRELILTNINFGEFGKLGKKIPQN